MAMRNALVWKNAPSQYVEGDRSARHHSETHSEQAQKSFTYEASGLPLECHRTGTLLFMIDSAIASSSAVRTRDPKIQDKNYY